jgi:hypothetical protein
MRLKYYKFPFMITLLASILPWVTTFSGLGLLTWFPEIIALLAFIYFAFSARRSPSLNVVHIFIICIFAFHLLIQVVSGKGIGSSAVISVILLSILFFNFFRTVTVEKGVKVIIGQISIIYSIHICFILLEVYLINTNNVDMLMRLSNGRYKAGVLEFYAPVPQSLFKNSQAASQQCIFAAAWFVMLYLSRNKLGVKLKVMYAAVLITALATFVVYPTTTVQALGLVMLFAIVYLKPFSGRGLLRFLLPITVLFFSTVIYEKLIYKISYDLTGPRAQLYLDAFIAPLYTFFRLSISDQLWGAGSMESIAKIGLKHGDFGFGVQILQIGLVLSVVALTAFLVVVIKMFRFAYGQFHNTLVIYPWLWLGSANALLAVGNILSLVHYTVSLQVGGRTLLSFHIAIILLSLQKLARHRHTLLMSQRSLLTS